MFPSLKKLQVSADTFQQFKHVVALLGCDFFLIHITVEHDVGQQMRGQVKNTRITLLLVWHQP